MNFDFPIDFHFSIDNYKCYYCYILWSIPVTIIVAVVSVGNQFDDFAIFDQFRSPLLLVFHHNF